MKLKHFLRYPWDIRAARQCLSARPENQFSPNADDSKVIALDLYTDTMLVDCARHLACIAAHASQIGSPVILRCDKWMLAAIAHKPLGADFLSMPHVSWIDPQDSLPDNCLALSDIHAKRSGRPLGGVQFVSMMVGSEPVANTPVMPYPMFPRQILETTTDRMATLRQGSRAGIFFGGNLKARYGRETMMEHFGVMPRLEMIQTVKANFADRVEPLESNGDARKIVLRDSQTHPIDGSQWMSILARHRFFLCCPGASQPVCHNLIESISVGAIPLIEYGDRLTPKLIDGVNAICFRGREGLIQAIKRIDRLSIQQLDQMTLAAIDHYDTHWDGARFLRNVRDGKDAVKAGAISMPFHDRNLYGQPANSQAA